MPGNMERRKREDDDVLIESCRTCGARHYTANASPAPFFKSPVRGKSMVGWRQTQSGIYVIV